MATSRGPFAKRQKELARREKQKEKQARRLEAKDRSAEAGVLPEGEEGDQRRLADQLVAILAGRVEPRTPEPVPDIIDTVTAMSALYARLL